MMWIVCQIGAREHYAIARALYRKGKLSAMMTEFWIPDGYWLGHLPGLVRLSDRYHSDLSAANVAAPNLYMLGFELWQRLQRRKGWSLNMLRNVVFQKRAIARLSRKPQKDGPVTLFSYSYAASDLFLECKKHQWKTVLGQIDPGPEEERIVMAEHQRYPDLGSKWKPAPAAYWESWREEVELADVIVVNSEWSRKCLLKEGVAAEKIQVIPLVYERPDHSSGGGLEDDEHVKNIQSQDENHRLKREDVFQVLFLGQINLRKGMGRLLDAFRLLKDEAIHLTLAGPCEIDPEAWADLPNVEWLGSVPRSQVGELYENSDVFILPTLSDGYAITQLEALSRGLPVIASEHCGSAVENGVNGWVLKDLEPESIAKAILLARDEGIKPVNSTLAFDMHDLSEALEAIS